MHFKKLTLVGLAVIMVCSSSMVVSAKEPVGNILSPIKLGGSLNEKYEIVHLDGKYSSIKSSIEPIKEVVLEKNSLSTIYDLLAVGKTYSADEVGEYIVGSTKVTVVEPKLDKTEINSSVGYKGKLVLSGYTGIDRIMSSNNDVVKVDYNGNYELVGEGSADIIVVTDSNVLTCKVVSAVPNIDTSEIKLFNGDSYKIEVNNGNESVIPEFTLVDGKADVSQDGVISNIESDKAVVHVKLGTYEYDKTFERGTEMEKKWLEMQPYIQECLGTPYVFGGNTPKVGIDCSGYVSYVYRSVGLMEGRTTAQGLYDMCDMVDTPVAGDLVFFQGTYDSPNYITHVGIYAGDNNMYHSGEPNQLSSLDSSYWQNHIVGYGRMID